MRQFFKYLSLFSAVVIILGQRLCSDGPPEKMAIECCVSLPRVVDLLLNETCIGRFAKNTQKQTQDKPDTPKGNCVIECIANQTRIYKGNGLVDHITLKRLFMNSVSGDRQWGDIVAKAVDVCVNETRLIFRNYKFNRSKTFDGEIVCHPVSGYLFGCLQTELFVKCPNMTQTSECESLQQYATNCHLGVKYS